MAAAVVAPATSNDPTAAGSPVASLTAPAMSRASTNPRTTPTSEPVTPSRSAPLNTKRLSWSRVAPAARSSPTSRARSPTVMVSVLTIRNAPTNSTIAATSAAVDWNALEEARRLLAMSPGDDEDVRLGHPRLEPLGDGRERLGLELEVDARRAGEGERRAGDVDRDDDRAAGARRAARSRAGSR